MYNPTVCMVCHVKPVGGVSHVVGLLSAAMCSDQSRRREKQTNNAFRSPYIECFHRPHNTAVFKPTASCHLAMTLRLIADWLKAQKTEDNRQ